GLRVPESWDGRELAFGLRPEHLLRADAAGESAGQGMDRAGTFDARIEVVEPVGSEIFVNLRLGEHALVARLPPGDLPRAGEALPMRVAVDKLHVFDPDQGDRLEA